jgi:hypothetical protein
MRHNIITKGTDNRSTTIQFIDREDILSVTPVTEEGITPTVIPLRCPNFQYSCTGMKLASLHWATVKQCQWSSIASSIQMLGGNFQDLLSDSGCWQNCMRAIPCFIKSLYLIHYLDPMGVVDSMSAAYWSA